MGNTGTQERPSLRIGIDYLPAETHWPGVGRYARELVRALVRIPQAPELRLFGFGAERRTISEPALGLRGNESQFRSRSIRLPRRALTLLHGLTGIGADRLMGGVDIFHRILPYFPPVSSAIQTMAVGELPPSGSEADSSFGRRLAQIDHLFVASRHAEQELQKRYGLPQDRVHFVSLGCDHWRRDLPEFSKPKGKPSLLVLGTVRHERRQVEILGAFEQLYAKGLAGALVIVGGGVAAEVDRFRSALQFSPARSAVQWLEAPNESDLPGLVAEASVLIHLSRGEETAVTPLEAFSFGTAVLTNPGGPFEEALGSAAHYFATSSDTAVDLGELATQISRAIEVSGEDMLYSERQRLAAEFTWKSSARRTVEVWSRIAANSHGKISR